MKTLKFACRGCGYPCTLTFKVDDCLYEKPRVCNVDGRSVDWVKVKPKRKVKK